MRIGEVAKQLDVTTATVRNWIKLFGDEYLSDQANKKNGKRFTPSDVATLREIQRLLHDGLRYEDIPHQLQPIPEIMTNDTFEGAAQQPFDIPDPTVDRENAIQPLEFFENFINQMTTQHEREIVAKDEMINELKGDKTRLQAENDELRRAQRPFWEKWRKRSQG